MIRLLVLGCWLLDGLILSASAQSDVFEEAPIKYSETTPNDIITERGEAIARSMAEARPGRAQLEALLHELNIPTESQSLVFSKTSLQNRLIHPGNPRAIYFNDDLYVGYIPGGDIELSTVDPMLGAVFYRIPQHDIGKRALPFERDARCMDCHGGSRTRGWPGFLVRSVFPTPSGQPDFSRGTFVTHDGSPFSERWGGWYATGDIGTSEHMANHVLDEGEWKPAIETTLAEKFRTNRYPRADSDVVALLVLEHQVTVHNVLIQANLQFRRVLHLQSGVDEALGRPPNGELRGTAKTVAESQVQKVLDALLFRDAFPFEGEITAGAEDFTKAFLARRRADSSDRSLRDFRLRSGRMFQYRCSYMIHSASFDHLPDRLKAAVYERLLAVLVGTDESGRYTHLRPTERRRILRILVETKKDLPPAFAAALDGE